MPALDPSQRSVKLEGDYHTVETSPQRKQKGLLCNHCGFRETCEIYRDLSALNATHYAELTVRQCAQFRPCMGFAPPLKGFHGRFNSFRMGSAWYGRVKADKLVALYDTRGRSVFGTARVVAADCGPLSSMLELYAAENHYLKAQPHEKPEEELYRLMRNLIGTGFVKLDRAASVVVMDRVDEPQEAVSPGAGEARAQAARTLL